MIIDSHLHLSPTSKGFDFYKSKKELLNKMNKNKIDYAIIIPDNIQNSRIGDLNKCLEITKDEKKLFLLGSIDIKTQGKEWIDKLDYLLKEEKIKGIKIFPGHDPIYPIDERLFPVYELCQKYDIPLVVHTGENSKDSDLGKYNDPKYLVALTEKFHGLKILICHYFWPRIEYCYNMTKKHPRIYFDTSALANKEVLEMSGEETLKHFLKRTIMERPGQVLYGSDYACEGCTMEDHIELIESLGLTKQKEEEVFYKNAIKLFKLDLRE
jgi:uncharacterized protein